MADNSPPYRGSLVPPVCKVHPSIAFCIENRIDGDETAVSVICRNGPARDYSIVTISYTLFLHVYEWFEYSPRAPVATAECPIMLLACLEEWAPPGGSLGAWTGAFVSSMISKTTA